MARVVDDAGNADSGAGEAVENRIAVSVDTTQTGFNLVASVSHEGLVDQLQAAFVEALMHVVGVTVTVVGDAIPDLGQVRAAAS